jgi:hypothetical protein
MQDKLGLLNAAYSPDDIIFILTANRPPLEAILLQ